MKDIEDYLSGIIRDMQDEIDLLEHQIKRYRELIEKVELLAQHKEYDDIYNLLVESEAITND